MCWEAGYRDNAGKPFSITATATNECPVSLLSDRADRSLETVQSFAKAQLMFKNLGASPYGGDLNKWPSKMVDAFVLLQDEHNRVEAMRIVRKPT